MIASYIYESELYNSIDVTFCFGVALIAVFAMYITSKRIKSFESNLYLYNFILNLVVIAAFISYGIIYYKSGCSTIIEILGRVIIFLYGLYITNYALYLFACCKKDMFNNNKKKAISFLLVPYILYIINCVILLPQNMITYYDSSKDIPLYSQSGPALFAILLPCIELFAAYINIYFRYFKNINKEFKTSVIWSSIGVVCMLIVLVTIPDQITILPILISFITIIVYFTSESVNIKLIDTINKSRIESEIANNAQEDFLNTISHDIRTPLNVILGFSESITNDIETTDLEIKDDAKNINLACIELNELVNRILDISKIASGTEVINNQNYSLIEMIKSISDDIAKDVELAKVNFKIDINPELPYQLNGDFVKLNNIIKLIIKNIIRNNSETLDVKFDGTINDNKLDLIIRINHTGSFFSKEEFNIDFNNYLSEISKDKDSFKSDFLGILIAKEYINILNGSITYEENINTWYEIIINQSIVNQEKICETEIYKASKRGDQ